MTPAPRRAPEGRPGVDAVCQYVRASDTSSSKLSIIDHFIYPGNEDYVPSSLGHYACVPAPQTPRRGCILVLTAGLTGAKFAKHAASLGFHAILLGWWSPSSGDCTCGACLWRHGLGFSLSDAHSECEHAVELARLFGNDDGDVRALLNASALASSHFDRGMTFQNAIEGRLLALLLHLGSVSSVNSVSNVSNVSSVSSVSSVGTALDVKAQSSPYATIAGRFWLRYVRFDEKSHAHRPAWEQISFAGHSRGGIYGLLVAQRYSVPRVIFLDSPTSHVGNSMSRVTHRDGSEHPATSVPRWMSNATLATPAERFYGLSGMYEGNLACWLAQPIWDTLKLRGVATVTDALATSGRSALHHGLRGAHQIYDLDICRSEPPSPHSHSCLLANLPSRAPQSLRERNHTSLFAVWSYMLTHGSAPPVTPAHERVSVGDASTQAHELAPREEHTQREERAHVAHAAPSHRFNVSCAPMRGNASGYIFKDELGQLVLPASGS